MEENKTMETQEVNTERKELSYDELKNVAAQLQQENMQFRQMINQINYNNFFKRLDYLFEVLKLSHMFPQEFTTDCSDEIMQCMKIISPEDEVSSTTENTKN